MKRASLAIGGAIGLFIFGLFLIAKVGVNLLDFFTGLAIAAFCAIVPLLYWGFKPSVYNFIGRTKDANPTTSIYSGREGHIDNGIHYYKSRDELPPLESILAHATIEIGFIGVTLEHISTQDFEPVRDALVRGVKVTLLVLHPDSQFVKKKEDALGGTKDLNHRIRESITRLLEEKAKLPADKKNNFVIGTYDQDSLHSIIVIDPDTEHGWIKIEEFPYRKYARDRPSEVTTKKENISYFQRCYAEYNNLANGFIERYS